MKALKVLLKIFLFSALLMAIIIGSIAVYMRVYGDAHIKKALTELAGARVEYKSAAINLDKKEATFRGFSVASQIGLDKDIFGADIFTIILNKEKLEKEKKIVFDSVRVKGAKLNIIRDKAGALNVALPKTDTAMLEWPLLNPGGIAYAADAPSKNALYDALMSVRNIKVEDSVITFEDYFMMEKPYKMWCDRFFAEAVSTDTGSGYFSTAVTANFRVPQKQGGHGSFGMKANMAVYPGRTDMELSAETGNIDLLIFLPYFRRSTPFDVRSGRFGSKTDFRMHNGIIDSLTTMYFRNLSFIITSRDENAQFLHVSINRLAPYLKSGDNTVFDFTMKGDVNNPQFSVGPKVKFAMGMVVMEEVGKAIQQMQRP
ncbi:MAG: DUF748 domain-containing protein [Candidatus Omnitrophica bacterium]|nr:DUF748 domain-containing protein [Candidatus Omnitrophota bacterium]